MNRVDDVFVGYCMQLTDQQLENVLKKEWEADEHRDYASAKIAAEERGWSVRNGERIV